VADETQELRELEGDLEVQVRDASKRELDIRVVPWDDVIYHQNGPEMFARGAFADVDPRSVLLKGPDAEGTHRGPLVGRGLFLQERDDGAYMTFKVSKTQAGDELLTLVSDGVVKGASVGFFEVDGGSSVEQRSGKRVRVHRRAGLEHVATTFRPAYKTAGVIAMRSRAEGEGQMAETTEAAAVAAAEPAAPVITNVVDLSPLTRKLDDLGERFEGRIHAIEERARMDIQVPQPVTEAEKPKLYQWAHMAVRMLRGEKIPARELQERALADVTTSDAPGVVPDAFLGSLLEDIVPARPFLSTTRQIPVPQAGMSITVPVLGTRATVDVQANEKTEIESTTPTVTTDSFDAVSIFGGADVSIQLIRRSDPSFMDLLMQELAEAYALKADSEAIAALLAATPTPGTGGSLDPNDLTIGEAWANSIAGYKRAPDHIWLSSDGVQAFIDAKASGTNAPLYGDLGGAFTVANGAAGRISGLIPVYVPALDGSGVDVLIGPSAGFVWAEDGTFELSADNPTLAGRDIALGGILFFIPRYPAAFTTYAL
jgi:HK97 family phage major capsid protein/HK97 family phage prohead protease